MICHNKILYVQIVWDMAYSISQLNDPYLAFGTLMTLCMWCKSMVVSFQLLLPPLGRCHLFVLNHLSDLSFHWVGYQPRIWTILQKMLRQCARTKVFWFGWQCIRGSNASRWRWFFWMPFGSSEQNEGWSYQTVDWKAQKDKRIAKVVKQEESSQNIARWPSIR